MKLRIIYLLLFVFSFANTFAQDVKNQLNPVYYGVASLAIAPDARAGGLGDVGAATDPDVNSQFWNPAKYPFCISRAGISLNYTPWLRKLVNDIDLANITGYFRLGEYNALSASLRYFSLGEVIATEDLTIKPYELAVDVAYSRMLSETFSAAVALRYIRSDLGWNDNGTTPGNAFAADIAMYHNGYLNLGRRECQMGWGINISNIGSKLTYGGSDQSEFIPTNLRIGMNLTVPFNEYNKFSLGVDLNKLLVPTPPKQEEGESPEDFMARVNDEGYYGISSIAGIFKSFGDAPGGFKEEMEEIQWSIGAEYTYNDRFMLRAGYHHEAENKGNRKYFTVGAGFHMSVFTVDAAYVFSTAQTNPLDQTMRFSLAFDLDGMRDLFGKMRRRR